MPTTRQRHVITETEDVAAALADAAKAWPEAKGNANTLIRHLIEVGRRALLDQESAVIERRLADFDQVVGSLPGLYEPGYLAQLREDWPA